MLEENCISLAKYRMETSMETLNVARECLENKHFKDSINRAYYASFYAARAVLALERVDFKRHKESKVITMIFLFHRKKKLKNNLIMQRV